MKESKKVKKADLVFGSLDEFLKNAEPTDLFEKIRQSYKSELIDEARLRRDRDWSRLNNQVFGAECSD